MQCLIGTLFTVLLIAVTTSVLAQEKAAEKSAGDTPRQAVLAVLTQLETSFNQGNAKGLAACWTETGEFVGPGGARADGRESIEKQFQEAFASHKEPCKLQIHVNHLRLVSESLALVEAVAEVKPAPPTGGDPVSAFVLVKQKGRWLIESTAKPLPICRSRPTT